MTLRKFERAGRVAYPPAVPFLLLAALVLGAAGPGPAGAAVPGAVVGVAPEPASTPPAAPTGCGTRPSTGASTLREAHPATSIEAAPSMASRDIAPAIRGATACTEIGVCE